MTDKKALEAEISKNYEAFKAMPFSEFDKGKFALLRNGELVETMNDRADAHKLAAKLFPDGIYSIQEILPMRADLGYMSHALC